VPSAEPVQADPLRRAAAMIAVVVVVILGAATWVSIAAVQAINRQADAAPAEMVHAVPATYRPVAPAAAPVANAVPLPMGNWTAPRGVQIAERALRWRGWPYSFGAGGPNGPSYGHAVDADSRNDGSVFGFDCSGLTMFAVAPWRSLVHDAATQYNEVGSYHPSIDSLQPGDLVFWSKNGTVNGIGHVAVYIGNGEVVQAPQSGDVVRVSPIYQVEPGTMGATRPLT
jgi:cell wall-associated NlpC family hydrolase